MPRDEINPNTGLCAGMLKRTTTAVLTLGAHSFDNICEGWGTKYCANCPYADLIPECCPALEENSESVLCPSCELICPCNRSVDYQKIRREVLNYEQRRLVGDLT